MKDNSMLSKTEYNLDSQNLDIEVNCEPLKEEGTNLDSEQREEETNLNEVFTPDELEELIYSNHKILPFSELSPSKKGKPLEKVIRRYCISLKLKYDIPFKDLARIKNHKKTKGQLNPDFVISDLAAIEAKNWDCFGGYQYVVAKKDLDNQVLCRYTRYSHLKKILVIANPWWTRDAPKYLVSNRVEVIEVGFQVTFSSQVMEEAFWKIKPELDKLLYIQYLPYHKLFDYLV